MNSKTRSCLGLSVAIIAAVAALTLPLPASAGYWQWGYNYLGPNTNNGLCGDVVVPEPGSVCSGWNYWRYNVMDKLKGGAVCIGWANQNSGRCYVVSGVINVSTSPADLGMGGYIKSQLNYEYGTVSYLQISAYT